MLWDWTGINISLLLFPNYCWFIIRRNNATEMRIDYSVSSQKEDIVCFIHITLENLSFILPLLSWQCQCPPTSRIPMSVHFLSIVWKIKSIRKNIHPWSLLYSALCSVDSAVPLLILILLFTFVLSPLSIILRLEFYLIQEHDTTPCPAKCWKKSEQRFFEN